MVDHFDKNEERVLFDDTELNLQQYYTYYKMLADILESEIGQKGLSVVFIEFWKEITMRVSCLLPQSKRADITAELQDHF